MQNWKSKSQQKLCLIGFHPTLNLQPNVLHTDSIYKTVTQKLWVSVSVWVNCEHWSGVGCRHCHHTCLPHHVKYSDMVLLATSGNKISHRFNWRSIFKCWCYIPTSCFSFNPSWRCGRLCSKDVKRPGKMRLAIFPTSNFQLWLNQYLLS